MRRAALGVVLNALALVAPACALPGAAARLATDPTAWALLALVSVLVCGEIALAPAAARPAEGADPAAVRLARGSALALLALLWAALAAGPASPPFAVAGLAVLAAGVALRLAAIRALGAWFSSEIQVAPGQPLVTRGPFALVRHPSELGLLAVGAGAAVARVRREDRLRAAAFGPAYRAYAAGVPALFPKPLSARPRS